jgi:hypothetical protein
MRRAGGLAGLAIALAVAACAGESPGSKPEPPVVKGPRLVILGIDGATWQVLGPLIDSGQVPAFARLAREGAVITDLDTLANPISPAVWTTIATGLPPEVHGIESFVTELADGKKIPVTGNLRRAPALWEVVDRARLRVGVVGWWASWPAEAVDGYMVTDHANPAFTEFLIADGNYWTADAGKLSELQLDALPVETAAVVARHTEPRDGFPFADLQRRSGLSDAQRRELESAPWHHRSVYSWFKTFYRSDLALFRAGLELGRQQPTDLQMLYLRGPDAVQHYGWNLFEPEAYPNPPPNLERDRGLVEGVYRYLDTFLAELLSTRDRESWLLVVSDHGAEPSPAALAGNAAARPGEHGPNAKGILMLLGPGVRVGHQVEGGSVFDIAPTAAWMLGVPVAADLPGKPLRGLFTDDALGRMPVSTVPSWGRREPGPLLPSSVDAKMVESLRALGYIQ